MLRRRRHPRGEARLLPPPERAHPRAGRGARLRHAAHDLQRLHAQPAPGEQAAARAPDELERVNANLEQVGARALRAATSRCAHLLWELSEGDGYERFKEIAVKSLTGLKVAPFYGCQILRPSKVLGFEDPDTPELARAADRGLRRRGDRLPGEGQVLRLPDHPGARGRGAGEAILPLQEAADAGADVIVTPCPLCHLSLDAWQAQGREEGRPRVQHAGAASRAAAWRGRGHPEDELKFKRHVVRLPARTKRKLLQPEEAPAEAATT